MVNNMLNNLNKYINSKDYEINLLPNKVHIINYKSIIDITSNEVILKLNNKISKIKGTDIKAIKLTDNELLISGNIKGVTFNE